jgi:hypothetical protein
MNKFPFKIHIEIINSLIDYIFISSLCYKCNNKYKEYIATGKPSIIDLMKLKLSLYITSIYITTLKFLLYFFSKLNTKTSLKIILFIVKINTLILKIKLRAKYFTKY